MRSKTASSASVATLPSSRSFPARIRKRGSMAFSQCDLQLASRFQLNIPEIDRSEGLRRTLRSFEGSCDNPNGSTVFG